MCGRYVQTSSPADLAARFHIDEVRLEASGPDFNVAPRSEPPIVFERDGLRVLERLRWGLVPAWAKDLTIGDRMINARAETVASKPAYKRGFARRRCIVPADGFYEWQAVTGRRRKQPYFIYGRDRLPLALAGLREVWNDPSDPDATEVGSFTIITTAAGSRVAPIHDRMPVVLPDAAWDLWLDPGNGDIDVLAKMLAAADDDVFDLHPVGTAVNRPQSRGSGLVEPIASGDPEAWKT